MNIYAEDNELTFSPTTHQKSLLRAWEQFIKTGKIEKGVVPEYIAESWLRSRKNHINPHEFSASAFLDPKEYERRKSKYNYIAAISRPLMDRVYESLEKSRYTTSLFDPGGYHLYRIGRVEDFERSAHQFSIREGICFSEEAIGTTGFSLVKQLGNPIQIVGCEHYHARLHHIVGSYAPICNKNDGSLIGVVSIAGARTMPNDHTLGIAIAMSRAIENLIMLDQSRKMSFIYGKALQMMMDSLSDGIIILDDAGKIYELNKAAKDIFHYSDEAIAEIKGRYLSEVSEVKKLDRLFRSMQSAKKSGGVEQEQEQDIEIDGQIYITSLRYVQEETGQHQRGFLFQLKNLKKLSTIINERALDYSKMTFETMIGNSPEMMDIKNIGLLAAKSDASVIIEGESGTGKEIFARVIHNESSRQNKPLVIINCTAIPSELMESTLFGHEQGAFTGARYTHIGKFEQANEGTIFLDEIADMPPNMQAKLLRVIEEGYIERVGGNKPIQVNVRFIAATNLNINLEIAEKRFREDLFYRLNVFRIKLPPLRERKEDIHQLVPLFIRRFSSFFHKDVKNIAGEYYHALLRYHWPGNIRELRNAVEYSLAIMEGTTLSDAHLNGFFSRTREFVNKSQVTQSINGRPGGEHFTDSQEHAIRQALVETGGNKLKAAKLLGISRATIHRKLKKMNP